MVVENKHSKMKLTWVFYSDRFDGDIYKVESLERKGSISSEI